MSASLAALTAERDEARAEMERTLAALRVMGLQVAKLRAVAEAARNPECNFSKDRARWREASGAFVRALAVWIHPQWCPRTLPPPSLPQSSYIPPTERVIARDMATDAPPVRVSVGDALRDAGLDPETEAELARFCASNDRKDPTDG